MGAFFKKDSQKTDKKATKGGRGGPSAGSEKKKNIHECLIDKSGYGKLNKISVLAKSVLYEQSV